MPYRIFIVCVMCLMSFIMTACGGDTPAETTTESTSQPNIQSPSGSSPANFAPPSTALTQTINSELGITYQLPDGWTIQDNQSVSNFASDEDAVLDFPNQEKRNSRWLLVGNFGVATPERIDQLAGIATIEEAAPILSGYYYTEENPIVAPSFITLADGRRAYFVINQNDDILNATYFMVGTEGIFISLFFSGSEAAVNASRDLMNAIASSAVYGN